MATILVNQTNGGMLQQYGYSTWSLLRNDTTALNVSLETGQIKAVDSLAFKEIDRVFLSFDTSSLTNIISLSLNINIGDIEYYSGGTPSIMVLKSPTTNNSTNLNIYDFGIYPTVTYISSVIHPDSTGLYKIPLNMNALSDANLNGELDLVLVDYNFDYLNVAPSSGSYNKITFNYHTVYLEYDVSVDIYPDSIPTYGKINGIDYYSGSLGKINGLSVTGV